jgi:hypothetical protein
VLALTSASSFAADVSPGPFVPLFGCVRVERQQRGSLPEEVGPSLRPVNALVDLMKAPDLV